MAVCRITVMKQTVYRDLMQQFENPIEHACDLSVGQTFYSKNAERPQNFCESAWQSLQPFVSALNEGKNNFYNGWMKNRNSAMISCNDGFRPVSFYIELLSEGEE